MFLNHFIKYLFFFHRLENAVSSGRKGGVLSAAKSERKLMETYQVVLPAVCNLASPPGQEDSIAKDILRKCHPLLLEDASPRAVYGDGNCMYRAVSLALYGTEQYHAQLRLLTTLEIIDNRTYYDNSHRKFVDLIKDQRIVTPCFDDLLAAAYVDGSYSDMLHIYALSAAAGQCFTSYYPPTGSNEVLIQPFNRRVQGRDVRGNNPSAILMWSQMKTIQRARDFRPNHFALLHRNIIVENVDLTEDEHSLPASRTQQMSTPKVHAELRLSPLLAADSPSSDADSPGSIADIADSPGSVTVNQSSVADSPGSDTLSLTPSMSRNSSSSSFSLEDELPSLLEDLNFHHSARPEVMDSELSDSETESIPESESIPADHAHSITPRADGVLQNGQSLGLQEALEKVTTAEEVLGTIPPGLKEDVFFVVSNKGNNERRANSLKSEFMDDCGAWVADKTGTPKSFYVKGAHGRYGIVKLYTGIFSGKKVKLL